MDVNQLVVEASSLPHEQRKVLISRLLALGREERESAFRQMLAQKIDDHDPAHWVPMDQLADHLQLRSTGE